MPGPEVSPVQDLVQVMDTLRSPGGCPWDAEQTHASLLKYLVEETYEVVDAVEHGGPEELREELGDLLLQVVFHARIAQEHPAQPFTLDDVAASIAAKLRRRHPHVFGDVVVADADEVSANWEQIKQQEKRRSHPLDDIPSALPALARATKFVSRLASSDDGSATPAPVATGDLTADQAGSELYSLVGRIAGAGLDPETCLRDHLARMERAMRDPSPLARPVQPRTDAS